MKMKSMLLAGALISSVSVVSADHHAKPMAKADLVDTAVAAGQFKTLAAALGAADLVNALKGDGPFTVFAPTDAAFAKLPAGTVESLLKPENKDQLVEVLTYHVVAAKVPAKVAVTLDEANTLSGGTLAVTRRGGDLFLNDSKVIQTDIMATNGIIHVIDTVLLPPSLSASHAAPSAPVQQLARAAIDRGVPLYNHGNHRACEAVYAMAIEAMLTLPNSELSSGQRQALRDAMHTVGRHRSATTNAWTLRHALDAVMAPAMTQNLMAKR